MGERAAEEGGGGDVEMAHRSTMMDTSTMAVDNCTMAAGKRKRPAHTEAAARLKRSGAAAAPRRVWRSHVPPHKQGRKVVTAESH